MQYTSRRATLKGLGAAGAAALLGVAAAPLGQEVPAAPKPAPEKPTNAVDVAIDRFSKGHS